MADTAIVAASERPDRGLWDDLERAIDPVSFRPTLQPDVELKVFRPRRGDGYAIARNPRDLVHYRLTLEEAEILPLLDGTRTVREVVIERFRESGDIEPRAVADLIRQLQAANFLREPYVDVYAGMSEALQPRSARLRRALRTLTFEWHGAGDFAALAYRAVFRWFLRPAAGTLAWLIALAGIGAFVVIRFGGAEVPRSAGTSGSTAIALLAATYAFLLLHELSHAVVLVHYGRRVGRAGVMVYLGSPAIFVDTSDSLMLDPRQRVVHSLAGPVAELVIAGSACIAVLLFPDSPLAPFLYSFALLNYLMIVMNLVPLLELDGYNALCDALEVPDLRARSLRFVRHDLIPRLREGRRLTLQEVGFALYGSIGYLVTAGALWLSVTVWQDTFGGLFTGLAEDGVVGWLLIAGLVLVIGAPIIGGGAMGGKALVRRVRLLRESIRLRLETSWRVEAAELIDRLPLLAGLDEEVLSDLAARVRLRVLAAGTPLFRQGDDADAFYVVRSGTVHIIEENPDTGAERVIQVAARGDSFGELGLLRRAPRAATARPVDDAQVFVVDRATFDLTLARMVEVPDFAPTLQLVSEVRALPPFARLGSAGVADLLAHGSFVNFAPGSVIIRQGDVGDAFYAIAKGQVDVIRDGAFVRRLGAGDYVGEVALLTDAPRNATIVAQTPVRAFRLERPGFDAVIADAFRHGHLPPAEKIERMQVR